VENGDLNTERTEELTRFFNERAPIARYLGMRLSFTDAGDAVIDLPSNPNLDHALGGMHGGVYATMLDTAGWFASAAAHDGWVTTSELTIHFLLPAERTSLRAVGRMVKSGKRQDVAEVHLYDDQDRLIGHAVGTFVVLPGVPMS